MLHCCNMKATILPKAPDIINLIKVGLKKRYNKYNFKYDFLDE